MRAISGNAMILEKGDIVRQSEAGEYFSGLHPRTAIALDSAAKTMILVVVDGRQPNYSEGVSLAELSHCTGVWGL